MAVWRLVHALETLRAQVRALSPAAVPPATPAAAWGTVGDLAHQDGVSDHNPKVYPELGSVAVVCAADFPHAPALGLSGAAYTEAIRLSRDNRVGYVIFNGRIFSGHAVGSTPAFAWRTYTGADRHEDHWHVSTVHTAAADDPRNWDLGGTTTMTDSAAVLATHDRVYSLLVGPGSPYPEKPTYLMSISAKLDTLIAAAAADATRDAAMLAAVQAIVASGGLEAAPIIDAINEAARQTNEYVLQLQADLSAARADAAELRARLAVAFGPGSE